MLRRYIAAILTLLSTTVAVVVCHNSPRGRGGGFRRAPVAAETASTLLQRLNAMPIAFEPLQAQSTSDMSFFARRVNYSIALKPAETAFAPVSGDGATLHMRFVGASASARMVGEKASGAVSNYFVGKDPSKWRIGVPQYRAVRVMDLYDGIDLVYYGQSEALEHDLILAAGARPETIRISFGPGSKLALEKNGALRVEAKGSALELRAPKIYQQFGQRQLAVEGGYAISANNEIKFRLGPYDSTKPLIIDPVFDFSTYFGGTGGDYGHLIALDADGNIYLAGGTQSSDFPLKNPYQPNQNTTQCPLNPGSVPCGTGFLSKFNPTATALIYSTYFGGDSKQEDIIFMVVDSSQSVYLTGITAATDFPTTTGAYSTTFGPANCGQPFCYEGWVTKFAPSGSSLAYSTYLGGTTGASQPAQIAVDTSGDAVVGGYTSAADFPTTTGAYQTTCPTTLGSCTSSFVTKLNPAGSALIYSTFLGGSGGDDITSLALDSKGNPVVGGTAGSLDFPLLNPIQSTPTDAFLTKLKADGSGLLFSSYFGATRGLQIDFAPIVLDSNDNIYLTGFVDAGALTTTSGSYMPSAPANAVLPFVTKIDATGTSYAYSTYLGGTQVASPPFFAEGEAIAVDNFGQAYVVGSTAEPDFPQVNPLTLSPNFVAGSCSNPGPDECEKGFVSVLNAQGSALLFSSYLGGTNVDAASGVAIDSSQNIYVTGATNSTDFPTTANAYQGAYSGGYCYNAPCDNVFLSKIQISPISAFPTSLTFSQNLGGSSPPQTVMISNASGSAVTLGSIAVTGNFSQTNTCAGGVPAGSNCTVSVVFTPQSTATVAGNLTITYGTSNMLVVSLTGTGTAPSATISPSSIAFGPQPIGSTSSGGGASITNTGTGQLTITGVAVSGDYAETDFCGTTLAPGANCAFVLVFTPQNGGSRPGQLSVTTDASSTPLTVTLTGTGTGPLTNLSPTILAFGQQAMATTSAVQTVTLANSGTSSLAISSINVSGDFAQTNTCGTTVAAGATCTVSVTFAPTAAGSRAGALTVADNSFGSPRTVVLSGTGVSFSMAAPSGSPTSVTLPAGQAATFNLQVQGQGGFSGNVGLTANCGAVPMVTSCALSASSVQVSGSAPAAFSLSVGTTKRSITSPLVGDVKSKDGARRILNCMTGLGVVLLLYAALTRRERPANGMAHFSSRWHRLAWSNAAAVLGLLLLTSFVASCSGGGSGGGGSSGTTPGTYTVTVTATAAGASQTQNLTLIVQ